MKIFPRGHKGVVGIHLDHVLERAEDPVPTAVPSQGNMGGITLEDA